VGWDWVSAQVVVGICFVGSSIISGSIGSVGWMPVRSVSGSFGLGVANVEATPMCSQRIIPFEALYG
jgi:hypothetical protein